MRPGRSSGNHEGYVSWQGGKGNLYDLSLCTPIIFYWKDRLGASFNESSLVSSIDLAPTILDLVDVDSPDELLGYSLRTHRWHFFWYADTGEMLLYDVPADPRGQKDLSEQRPDLVAQFKQSIADWKKTVGMKERIDIHE